MPNYIYELVVSVGLRNDAPDGSEAEYNIRLQDFNSVVDEEPGVLTVSGWQEVTLTYEAVAGDGSLGSLVIALENQGDYQVSFDKVSITRTSIPEPATMLLLGIGLIGLAGLSRRRFRKK